MSLEMWSGDSKAAAGIVESRRGVISLPLTSRYGILASNDGGAK